jgi:hypothetical protein
VVETLRRESSEPFQWISADCTDVGDAIGGVSEVVAEENIGVGTFLQVPVERLTKIFSRKKHKYMPFTD